MTHRSFAGIAVFVLVGFGVPWVGWSLVGDERLSLWLFPLFCSVAGFVASFVEGGRRGLAAFSKRVFAVKRSLPWVVAGVLVPLAIGAAYLLGNGMVVSDFVLSPSAVLSLSLGAALITGPLAEEFGWRGYLQHKLLGRFAPIWVAVALGVIWWAWHYPLYQASVFAAPKVALSFLAYLVTWSIFMVYLVERAGGAVWPAIAMHWAANVHVDILRVLLPTVDGSLLPGGSKGAPVYLGVALAFVLVQRRFYFAPRREQPVAGPALQAAA
jgi:membrane protease YdiL (CAAX protease family)